MTKPKVNPIISVCIFTYNNEQYLPNTISSVYRNSTRKFEVVIVDDGSTDNTESAVKAMRVPNLRYIKKSNEGRPAARNRCIQEAKGEFILWLGADDALNEGQLDLYLSEINNYTDVDVFYGDMVLADKELNPVKLLKYEDWTGRPQDVPAGMVFRNGIPDSGTIVKKELYTLYGGYDLNFPRAQDYEWYSRISGKASFKHVGKPSATWRVIDPTVKKSKPKSSYGANVILRLLERFPLDRLVPQAGWEEKKENEAEALARLMLAKRFLKLNAPEQSLRQIRLLLKLKPEKEVVNMAINLLSVVENQLS